MVSSTEHGSLIYNRKLSSVGPGRVSGNGVLVNPTGMDLAMKLHYLRMVYYFPSRACEGLTIMKIKEPMFTWLNHVCVICGRFRRSESGRPCIKCNDCGVRLLEAHCAKSLEEWLETKNASLEKLLVSEHFVGPDLPYSPLVFLQYTKFKCGGMAVGLSWPHVLGDVFSAVEDMNFFGHFINGNSPFKPNATIQSPPKPQPTPTPNVESPLSFKRVDPVGDKWITVNNCNLEPFSFHVTPSHWKIIESKFGATETAPFESLCAVIWKIIAGIRREDDEPKIVTICKKDGANKEGDIMSNNQVVSVVEADFSIAKANHGELASMLENKATDEREMIEDAMERELGLADFVVYGANLTFVDMEGANFYGFEYQGEKPVCVSCMIDGVGDRGAVLVVPAEEGGQGRYVTVVLPEKEVVEFKSELEKEGLLG